VLKDCTIELGGGSTLDGHLRTKVWMFLKNLVVTIATALSVTLL
jgi:hypothetical protein